MTIEINPDQERIIREEMECGRFQSPEDVLEYALTALRKSEHGDGRTASSRSFAEFLMDSPLAGAGLTIERQQDFGRNIEL
jgi:Arc/MetJ-type ribon-helix-helix transcriptional regulator